MIKVDLRAVAVPPATRVWRLFPGNDYKFLERFLITGTAFLDLPAMTFPAGPLLSSSELMARMLASAKTKDNIATNGIDTPAITDWQQFTNARRTTHRSRIEQAIVNFYDVAKTGDYVVMPTTLSERRIHLGQIASNSVTTELFKYGNHGIPARSVRWLANVDEGKISTPLSKSLRHQHPFSLVDRSRFLEVFALVNGSYTYGEEAVATVYNRKNEFLDTDSALMGVLSKLAAASCEAVATGGVMSDITVRSLVSGVGIEFTCQQESDIHSEGFTRFISAHVTPLVVAALLSILLALNPTSTKADMAVQLQSIQVTNSLATNDPCVPPVDQATRMILNSVGIEIIYEMCKTAHEARARAGLEPSAQGSNIQDPADNP